MIYSYDLDHALQQIKHLEEKGLPNILGKKGSFEPVFLFKYVNDSIFIYDNNGNIMSKKEMVKLIDILAVSVENINENELIKNKINILKSEVDEYLKPKEKTKLIKDNKGYVYLLVGSNGKYKIGASKNPTRRCKELRLSSSENHELIYYFKALNMFDREKGLHEIFANKKSHSEWFNLSKDDVEFIKEYQDEY